MCRVTCTVGNPGGPDDDISELFADISHVLSPFNTMGVDMGVDTGLSLRAKWGEEKTKTKILLQLNQKCLAQNACNGQT